MKKGLFIGIILGVLLFAQYVRAEGYCYKETIDIINDNIIYVIKDDNTLWVINYSNDGADNEENKFEASKIMDNVISISCGQYGEYAVKEDNTLWTWEKSSSSDNDYLPIKVMDNVEYVYAGSTNVLIIKEDNTLWGMGSNYYGELGASEEKEYKEPYKIMSNVKKALLGLEHTLILKTDGSVFTLGHNNYGQLGVENIEESNVPIRILKDVFIKDIAVGTSASFAIDEDNNLWMCGTMFGNHSSQPEADNYIPKKYIENVKKISNHFYNSFILSTEGTLWNYKFKDNSVMTAYEKTQITDDVSNISDCILETESANIALKNNGDLYFFDKDVNIGTTSGIKIMENVKLSNNILVKSTDFSDIYSQSQEEQKAIKGLANANLVNGINEKEFAPNKNLTRAEIAAILLRMKGIQEKNNNGGDFADVTTSDWYYGVAGTSKKYGIINGFEDNTFRGDTKISKLQTVVLASRILQNEKFITSVIQKETDVPEWAKDNVSIAIDYGLISIGEDLNENITRGEAAVILYRLYELI